MGRKPKGGAQPLGKALQRRQVQNKAERAARENALDIDGSAARGKLVSVLETTSLDDFIASAVMADRTFEAKRGAENTVLLDADGLQVHLEEDDEGGLGDDDRGTDDGGIGGGHGANGKRGARLLNGTFEQLSVPRRPQWTEEMSPEELDRLERESFLAWRRAIAEAEEARGSTFRVTPFEKNLEVWRQLWRVLERSDLVVQIVDARNPLFFYSEDLHAHAAELKPPRATLVLMNKSDFLTARQRHAWVTYFCGRGWPCLFFSARLSQERLNAEARAARGLAEAEFANGGGGGDARDDDEDSDSAVEESSEGEEAAEEAEAAESDAAEGCDGDDVEAVQEEGTTSEDAKGSSPLLPAAEQESEEAAALEADATAPRDDARILSREELLAELERLATLAAVAGSDGDSADADANNNGCAGEAGSRAPHQRRGNQGRVCIGMVGYPNVGKSSVINVLVGATPFSHGAARVSVGATPGKTKHFQTLPLSASLLLCDCPGLVFPSFVSSAAEMVCAGMLPITQTRDHTAPAGLIARRVPRHVLELAYTIRLPPPPEPAGGIGNGDGSAAAAVAAGRVRAPAPTAAELLTTLALARGFIRGASLGEPDWPRAARMMLKDYTEGRLLFCHGPPAAGPDEAAMFDAETERTALRSGRMVAKLERQRQREAAATGAATGLPAPTGTAAMAAAAAGGAAAAPSREPTRREQGRKKWGKKNKKMLDPTPYDNKGDLPGAVAAPTAPGRGAVPAGRRSKHYGATAAGGFTRVTLPHHQTYSSPAGI
ncbi:unnamed protein product [Phaeothamnion confervicola]